MNLLINFRIFPMEILRTEEFCVREGDERTFTLHRQVIEMDVG